MNTRDEIASMTDDELRLAIAIASGWRWMQYPAPNISKETWLTGLFPPDRPGRIPVCNGYNKIWLPSDEFAPRFSNWDEAPYWDDGESKRGFPDWPRDIAAAWELAEEMAEIDCGVYATDGEWSCVMYMDGAGILAEAVCSTAPRAIAEAYLLWKQAQGE